MKICLSCEGVTDTQAHRCGYCDAPLLPTDSVHYPARRGELDAGNPLLGTVIDGKYRLQSVLGRGGIGTVFRAQHVGSLVTVALKLLHPRFAERPEYRRVLLPEARRAATVVHENCARLLDVGEGDEGITYLAMELVSGQTLDEVLQEGALAPSHAVDILIQVAAALSAVHDVGLVHCDLSPRNVMVTTRSGRVDAKVLDFGIARSMNLAGRRHAEGELWGFANPAFSAPEMLDGQEVDARADLYSLGTLAWVMFTGTMPVDDAIAERAVESVRAGHLANWPGAPGVPNALQRLVQRCMRFDPEDRPASAEEVHRKLSAVRTGSGPRISRVAMFVAALALIVTLAANATSQPAFLRPQPGSALKLSERALADGSPVEHLRAEELDTVLCHFAGFSPSRLRAEIARSGTVLAQFDLGPEVNRAAGTLLLSRAQPDWFAVVQGLLQASQDGPVDLALVVPGSALVRAIRLRVDNQAPTIEARLEDAEGGLRSTSELVVDLQDDIEVVRAQVAVSFADGPSFPLPLPTVASTFALGAALAERIQSVAAQGAGSLRIEAEDRAGNLRQLKPIAFEAADVAAPRVLEITGPAGQRSLSRHEDLLRWRVRLSAAEAGCALRCRLRSGEAGGVATVPIPVTDGSAALWHEIETSSELVGSATDVVLCLGVVDAAGNLSEAEFPIRVVDRSPVVEIRTREPQGEVDSVLWTGNELVAGPSGGLVDVSVVATYSVVGARLARRGQALDATLAQVRRDTPRQSELRIGALPADVYTVILELVEIGEQAMEPVERPIALRVLPERIDVYLPSQRGRFLQQLVAEGLLERVAKGVAAPQAQDLFAEGRGWRVDSELRPYVGGELHTGEGTPVGPVRFRAGRLLPDIVPASGHNLLTVELRDVLGREVRLQHEGGEPVRRAFGRSVVAEFWWSDVRPELVGEQVLLEHSKPVRVRVRMPLPFRSEDREQLRLGIPNGEVQAAEVTPEGEGAVVTFELPFSVWSVAAQLAGQPREAYADGLERTIDSYVATPAGRDSIQLALRTTRSTLAPIRLGDLTKLPAGLADLQLLPVLAPDGAFEEPMPSNAPPRFSFRPQHPVAVRNMPDILLQDQEFTWGQARALASFATTIVDPAIRRRCVHDADPLGDDRLAPLNLLPTQGTAGAALPGDDAVLAGVDFFQAWTCSRLLGALVGGDPALFRLPLGCELELAAFANQGDRACHGVAARGGSVRVAAFRAGTAPIAPWTSERVRSLGDLIATPYGLAFVGLDFGVREWVLDLPHIAGAEMLLREWTGDHGAHLRRVMDLAAGKANPPPDPLGPQQKLSVVRGLAFGEGRLLIDEAGKPLSLERYEAVPAFVPGVLRSEQLRRDGKDLVGPGREPRLRLVGFRVAGNAEALARRWGYR